MQILIYLCFLLSGVTGLIYEVLWGKYLLLLIGSGSFAHIIVLATFMGGLATGNILFGRLCDGPVRKLSIYAFLELGVGLSCAIYPWLLGQLTDVYLMLASNDPGSTGNMALKILLAACSILPPTILMGGTLPVLARYIIADLRQVGNKIGTLYFVNSAGAMAGCLLAGFHLIHKYGLEFSMILTAGVNISIGFLFLFLRRTEQISPPAEECDSQAREQTLRSYSSRQVNGTLALVFVTGILTMLYEVIWIRLLSLVLGSSSHSFSLMLFTFIGGIALGSAIVTRILRKDRDVLLLFALCEAGVFFSLLCVLPIYERLPYYFNVMASYLTRSDETFVIYLGTKVLMATLTMAVPAMFIGMTLPLASRVNVKGLHILGRGIGTVFSINTAGNIVGAVLGGFVFVPLFGLQTSLLIGIFCSGAVGFALYLLAGRGKPMARAIIAATMLAIFVFGVTITPRWEIALMHAGIFRKQARMAHSFKDYKTRLTQFEVAFHEDGPNLSAVVLRRTKGRPGIWLKVNGKTNASSNHDMPTQLMLSHIPLLLKPDSRKVAIIGLGSGVSAAAVLGHPVDSVDVVEISRSVVKASRFFSPVVDEPPLDDPRLHLYIADAKDFFRVQPEAGYDVIISEPSNPWISGIANLYSLEFFELVRSRLKPDGLMVQAVQLSESNDRLGEIVLNTFSRLFPYVTVWHTVSMDTILVGSMSPVEPDFDLIEKRLAKGRVNNQLNAPGLRYKIPDTLTFLSHQILGPEDFKAAFPGEGILNSDNFPVLEYEAPKALYVYGEVERLFHVDERRKPRHLSNTYLARYLNGRSLTSDEVRNLIALCALRNTRFDHPLLVSLVDSFNLAEGGESVAQEHHLNDPLFSRIGPRASWQLRIARGRMSSEEWATYLDYESRMLVDLTSIFVTADDRYFRQAYNECQLRFPETAEKLREKRDKLYRTLGYPEQKSPKAPKRR
jgi:spermidine synthase